MSPRVEPDDVKRSSSPDSQKEGRPPCPCQQLSSLVGEQVKTCQAPAFRIIRGLKPPARWNHYVSVCKIYYIEHSRTGKFLSCFLRSGALC